MRHPTAPLRTPSSLLHYTSSRISIGSSRDCESLRDTTMTSCTRLACSRSRSPLNCTLEKAYADMDHRVCSFTQLSPRCPLGLSHVKQRPSYVKIQIDHGQPTIRHNLRVIRWSSCFVCHKTTPRDGALELITSLPEVMRRSRPASLTTRLTVLILKPRNR